MRQDEQTQLKDAVDLKTPNYHGIKLNISVQETVPPRAHDLLIISPIGISRDKLWWSWAGHFHYPSARRIPIWSVTLLAIVAPAAVWTPFSVRGASASRRGIARTSACRLWTDGICYDDTVWMSGEKIDSRSSSIWAASSPKWKRAPAGRAGKCHKLAPQASRETNGNPNP